MRSVPAFKAALLAAGGIFIGKQFPSYAYFFLGAAICMVVIPLPWFLLGKERNSPIITGCVYAALSLSFAFSMSTNLASLSSSEVLGYSGFAGTVEEVPRAATSSSFVLKDCLGYDKNWKRVEGDLIMSPRFKLNLSVGDRMVFAGNPAAPSGARNPGDFDFKSFYRLSGIAGRIYVRNQGEILWVDHNAGFNFLRSIVQPLRDFMRSAISRFMRGDEAELAKAMIIGERSGIAGEINEEFVNTGTIHILAVSGLHIGFLMAMLMIIASVARVPRKLRFFVIAPVLILYAFVVGMTPSITRAVIMALVVLFGLFLQRRPQILNSLGFAALLILILNPSQLFTPGFQLSFAAVISIAFFHQRVVAMVHRTYPTLQERQFLDSIVSLSLLTLAATIGTVPLTAYYFNRISLVGVFANLCIVPLAGIFATMAFTFIGISAIFPWLAGIFGAACQLVGFGILKINSVLGSLSISSVVIFRIRLGLCPPLFFVAYRCDFVSTCLSGRQYFTEKGHLCNFTRRKYCPLCKSLFIGSDRSQKAGGKTVCARCWPGRCNICRTARWKKHACRCGFEIQKF